MGLVIVIGLILGAVGGVFSSSVQQFKVIHNFVGQLLKLYNGDHETMTVEIAADSNVNKVINDLKNMDGVK